MKSFPLKLPEFLIEGIVVGVSVALVIYALFVLGASS